MKKLIIITGALAMALGAPAYAKPGNGQGNQGNPHAGKGHGNPHVGKGHGTPHVSRTEHRHIVTTRSGGRLYALDARGSCPPGLARKGNGCMPPGQAKKMFNIGQRYNRNFGNLWSYNQIPDDLRLRYDFDRDDRFYYNNGYLYQVDPQTMLVQQVVSALLR